MLWWEKATEVTVRYDSWHSKLQRPLLAKPITSMGLSLHFWLHTNLCLMTHRLPRTALHSPFQELLSLSKKKKKKNYCLSWLKAAWGHKPGLQSYVSAAVGSTPGTLQTSSTFKSGFACTIFKNQQDKHKESYLESLSCMGGRLWGVIPEWQLLLSAPLNY